VFDITNLGRSSEAAHHASASSESAKTIRLTVTLFGKSTGTAMGMRLETRLILKALVAAALR